ncbi:hypothetical protein STAS_27060 [Striga asiatica]|uniref:DUF630 domain-containing protein n=1 Tax=Striga asiatica TaxID=4170 RepID=A0A5A7QWP8_STRAF|nr:hypothetical protein STAS_27060 [Striga asiatica]
MDVSFNVFYFDILSTHGFLTRGNNAIELGKEVVSICRERKRQIKRAVERRYALADAHYKYCQSLYGVSAAINLFVARHSPPPLYITIPSVPEKNAVVSDPLLLKQNPSESSKKVVPCDSCSSSRSSASEEHKPLEKVKIEIKK